jgi:hypothetical protein
VSTTADQGDEDRAADVQREARADDTASPRDARALVPDLAAVIDSGPVGFEHIVQARRVRQLHKKYGPQSRELEREVREKFVAQEGTALASQYYCTVAYGGCARAVDGRIFSVLNTYVADLVVLEGTIKQWARDAVKVFAASDKADQRQDISETLYSVLTRVMATADVMAATDTTPEARHEAVQSIHAEWSLARKRTASLIQREARFEYFGGVLIGALITLGLFSILGAVAAEHWPNQISAPSLLAASLSGTVGAVVSVGQRMSTGDLVLDFTASRTQKILLGSLRPLVGGTFATVVQFALLGGLLTMQGPEDTQNTPASFAFFALAGFAAGFSERLATDILERAGAMLVPPAGAAVAPQQVARPEDMPSSPAPQMTPPGGPAADAD